MEHACGEGRYMREYFLARAGNNGIDSFQCVNKGVLVGKKLDVHGKGAGVSVGKRVEESFVVMLVGHWLGWRLLVAV